MQQLSDLTTVTTVDAESSLPLPAGRWVADPNSSGVFFVVRHLGLSNVRGRFDQFDATLDVGPNLDEVSVTAEVELSSVDTNNADRDAHLRCTDFFDTDTHRVMAFRSTAIDGDGENYELAGDLTIAGITKPVTFAVEFNGTEVFPGDQSTHAGFTADRPDQAQRFRHRLRDLRRSREAACSATRSRSSSTSSSSPPTTRDRVVAHQERNMPTFETNQPIVLSIEMSQGAVHVIASDRTDTVVAVDPSDRGRARRRRGSGEDRCRSRQRDPFHQGAEATRHRGIPPRMGEGRLDRGDRGASGGVMPPRRRRLRRLPMRWPSRRRRGEDGRRRRPTRPNRRAARAQSAPGHVAVEEASDRAEIVAAGDMNIGVVAGDADIKNLNGTTWIGRVGGMVTVKSANGDVTIEDAGRDVTVTTANGNIRLGQVARGSVTIETAAGGLEIGVREKYCRLYRRHDEVRRVNNELTPTADPERSAETVQVHARTSFGDVLIARSSVPSRGRRS